MENLNGKIVKILKERTQTISFMESCTGGFLASCITDISGSSDVLKVSLVTYSNEYKIKFGVLNETIDKYTVYSIETAKEMAKNISDFSNSNFGIGITGELGNTLKEENGVYYCIYNKQSNEYIYNIIYIEPAKRKQMKEKIAECILEELWNILTKN